MKKQRIDIYTDGACSGNGEDNSKGGWSYCISNGMEVISSSYGGVYNTTNNRMELLAIVNALDETYHNISDELDKYSVRLFSDSAYAVNGVNKRWIKSWINNGWKTNRGTPVINRDLWEKINEFDKKFDFQMVHVKGHDGNYFNELCDSLAKRAIKEL